MRSGKRNGRRERGGMIEGEVGKSKGGKRWPKKKKKRNRSRLVPERQRSGFRFALNFFYDFLRHSTVHSHLRHHQLSLYFTPLCSYPHSLFSFTTTTTVTIATVLTWHTPPRTHSSCHSLFIHFLHLIAHYIRIHLPLRLLLSAAKRINFFQPLTWSWMTHWPSTKLIHSKSQFYIHTTLLPLPSHFNPLSSLVTIPNITTMRDTVISSPAASTTLHRPLLLTFLLLFSLLQAINAQQPTTSTGLVPAPAVPTYPPSIDPGFSNTTKESHQWPNCTDTRKGNLRISLVTHCKRRRCCCSLFPSILLQTRLWALESSFLRSNN